MTLPEAIGFVLEATRQEAQILEEDNYWQEASVLREAIQVVGDHHRVLR